jgi:hypothetical protein
MDPFGTWERDGCRNRKAGEETVASKKLDLYKLYAVEYVTPRTPKLVKTKPAKYLTIQGKGAPGGEEFQKLLGALYGVAFTIKMAQKYSGKDYAVCKLEGLWWGSKTKGDFSGEPPEQWNWKLIIRTPDFIKQNHLKEAVAALEKKSRSAEVGDVKLETIGEGLCVQMLHVGPYADESRTIGMMKGLAEEKGLRFHGLHHEIYLSDPRRVPAQRLKTILRIPVH